MSDRAWLRPELALFALGLLVFLPGLGARDLWNPDEPRYAEVAREMVVDSEYLVPHLNGEIYAHKPPLMFWAIAVASKVTGTVGPWAARLPSAFAGALCLPLLFLLGRELWSPRVGWLAALTFGSCAQIQYQARIGQIDMLLVLWVTLAVYLWLRGFTSGRTGFYYGFFAVGGVATLTKGPVGLLPPLLSILVFMWASGRRKEIGKLRVGRGLAVWALVVLAWLLPAGLRGGSEYLDELVWKQNVTRAVGSGEELMTMGHQRPWYHYFGAIAGGFFPWVLLLPAVALSWKELERASPTGLLLPVCWVATTFVFFSLSPAKRSVYVLTLYPALALLTGAVIDHLAIHWPRRRGWLRVPAAATLGAFTLLVAAILLVLPERPEADYLGSLSPGDVAGMLALPLLGTLAATIAYGRRRAVRTGTALLAGSIALAMTTLVIAVTPQLDRIKSPRATADALAARIDGHGQYVMYPSILALYPFYTGRYGELLMERSALLAYAEKAERPLIVGRREDLLELTESGRLAVLAGDDRRDRSQILVGLRDD